MDSNSAEWHLTIARSIGRGAAFTVSRESQGKRQRLVIENPNEKPLGAAMLSSGRCSFLVWAPRAKQVEVCSADSSHRSIPMKSLPFGYFHTEADGLQVGAEYKYKLDGMKERPDPASRFQPHGVHGPSQVVSSHFG